jgi:hypothetical protein
MTTERGARQPTHSDQPLQTAFQNPETGRTGRQQPGGTPGTESTAERFSPTRAFRIFQVLDAAGQVRNLSYGYFGGVKMIRAFSANVASPVLPSSLYVIFNCLGLSGAGSPPKLVL